MKVITMPTSTVNPDIFRAYDIRGIYPQEINENVVRQIARAFSKLLLNENPDKKLTVVVASDMRLSSPSLKTSVIEGLTGSGLDVIDIGLASTPTFYFAVGFYGYAGGLQVSASHNPSDYNGLKIVRSQGVPVSSDTGIYTLRDWVVNQDLPSPATSKGKVILKTNVLTDLIKTQTQGVNLNSIKPLTVVVDAANAMGSLDTQALFDQLPCKLIPLNFNLDGTFPAHEADPLKPENQVQIKEKVLENKADLGIAIDGDGDRYFIIMDNGELLPPEILRGILSQIVLKNFPGSPIGYDVRPGKITEDMILEAGGKPFITRVGHSLIKEAMIAKNSPFSGESSGHFFYRSDYGSYEMPVKMMVNFLYWLSQFNQPLSQIIKSRLIYFHSGEINSDVKDKEAVFNRLKEKYQPKALGFTDIDGVTFEYPDFWFNVRPSNTEPKVRLNLEARSPEVMEAKRDEVLKLIRS